MQNWMALLTLMTLMILMTHQNNQVQLLVIHRTSKNRTMCLRELSKWFFNSVRLGPVTLFQCPDMFWVKIFF